MDFKQYQLALNSVPNINIPPAFRQAQQPSIPPHMSPPGSGGSGGVLLHSVDYLSFGDVSLLPYIRRLVVTGYDADGIMHGWFGDDWGAGLIPMIESERQNYMFAAKSSDWLALKRDYDTVTEECVPFMVPLQRVDEREIVRAEETWSANLSMRDWMIGPRSMEDDVGDREGM
ncbi:hypothetical protein DFH27DRAFT_584334 [Peziza echinospora]|nr:hypothetical protein DFH27DRAFT_584334 [Peziza echinospora]